MQNKRWTVTLDGAFIGHADQWDGNTKASLSDGITYGGTYRSVIDEDNPTGVSDLVAVAMRRAGFDGIGRYTYRPVSDVLTRVWGIRAPYRHGTGQQEEFTGITVTRNY